jgi:hypothetical protein
VLSNYKPHDGYFPREFLPYQKEEAWEKMKPVFQKRPDLGEAAEKWKQYFQRRGR